MRQYLPRYFETIDGDFVASTFLLPLGEQGPSGEDRLMDAAGLGLIEDEGKILVDQLGFLGAAEKAGIDYDWHQIRTGLNRRINEQWSARIEYAWFDYNERTAGSLNDFQGHSLFTSVRWTWH